jgi:hypothetical protein
MGVCTASCPRAQAGEDPVLSQNATVSVSTLFRGFNITSLTEWDLVASTPIADMPAYTLRGEDGSVTTYPILPPPPVGPQLDVTLTPMQIRTFIATHT